MAKVAKVQVNIPVSVFREGKQFIAYTPVLDLASYGDTYEEAKRRFEEVLEIFFEETMKKGTLEEVLLEFGWQKVKNRWSPPILVSQETETIELPVKV